MLTLLLISTALAAPDREAARLEQGSTLTWLVTAPDAQVAFFAEEGSTTFWVLDTQTWDTTALSPCENAVNYATWVADSDGAATGTIYVACDEGTLQAVSFGADRDPSTSGESIWMSDFPALASAATSERVYAVIDGESSLEVHTYDIADGAIDADGGAELNISGLEALQLTSAYLVISHGSDQVGKLELATNSYSLGTENLAGRDFIDVASDGNSLVYLADSGGAILRFNLGSNDFSILLDDEDGLAGLSALSLLPEADDAAALVAAAESTVGEIWFYEYDAKGNISDDLYAAVAVDGINALAPMGRYLLGATSDGSISVITEAPWVDVTEVPSEDLIQGESYTVTFSSDTEGSWSAYVGEISGSALASGDIDAGAEVSFTLDVDSDYVEGANRVFVVVTDDDGIDGGDAADVSVDNPPSTVALSAADVGFGDEKVIVNIPGIEDEDLSYYEIYVDVAEWDPSDYASGGPTFSGDDDVSNPIQIYASAGEDVTTSVESLTNGVTYYVAVRAVDESGQEGEMSEVHSAIPQKTESAAGLVGDQGGFCGVGAGAPAVGLGLLGLMAAGLRRRRGSAGAMLLLGAALLPSTARAEDRPKKSSNVELRYGRVLVSDAAIQSVYGDDGNCDTCTDRFGMLYLEGGRQFGRLLELDGGVGVLQKQGSLVGVDTGEASDDLGRLLLAPVTASATLRLEIFREQILVPFGRVGADYWLWRERELTYSAADGSYTAADALGGGKPGYHYGFGVDLLLDRFDKSSASEAEARWGIHDTYLVVEWRTNEMLGEVSGLSFAGDALSVGLKIDR